MVTLKLMTDAIYEPYMERLTVEYGKEKAKAGNWSEEEALEKSRQETAELLPQGKETPGHYLFSVHNEADEQVGILWIAERPKGTEKMVWIFDIEVKEEHRRKGYARAIFTELEKYVRDTLGLNRIELHVFGHNTGAIALYQSLGFETMNIVMGKTI